MAGMSLGSMGEHGRSYASMNARFAQSGSSCGHLRLDDFTRHRIARTRIDRKPVDGSVALIG